MSWIPVAGKEFPLSGPTEIKPRGGTHPFKVREAKARDANKYFVRLCSDDFNVLLEREGVQNFGTVRDAPVCIQSKEYKRVVLAKRPLCTDSQDDLKPGQIRLNWDLRRDLGNLTLGSEVEVQPLLSSCALLSCYGKCRLAWNHLRHCPIAAHRLFPTLLWVVVPTMLTYLTVSVFVPCLKSLMVALALVFTVIAVPYSSYTTVTSESGAV